MTPVNPGSDSEAGSAIRTIWVVPLSHLDIGFTADQEEVFRQYKTYLDQVLAYMDEDPDFVYTIETVWQYLAWRRQTQDPVLEARMIQRVGQGRLGVGAAFASMHTGMLGMEELHRVFYHGAALARRHGFTLSTAWMNDIPGYNWALPRTLACAGLRYFVTGLNLSLGGGADIPPASIPFYWQGPDQSRILTWASTRNYLEAWEKYRLHEDDDEAMEAGVREIIGEWEEAGYPYDSVLAIAAAGDNLGPETARKIVRRARAWNARHDDVRVVVGTAEQFFAHMERRYAGRFPVLSGDWNGLWEFARGANSHGTAITRGVRFRIPQVEALSALGDARRPVLSTSKYPREALDRAYECLLTYDEHSAGNGNGWPKLLTRDQVVRHNAIAHGFAEDAQAALVAAERSLIGGMLEVRGDGPLLVSVGNGLSWVRSGVVEFDLTGTGPLSWRPPNGGEGDTSGRGGGDAALLAKAERSGEDVPVEVTPGGKLRFLARDVPAFGWRTYRIRPAGDGQSADSLQATQAIRDLSEKASPQVDGSVYVLESPGYRVEINAQGALVSILDRRSGRECVDGEGAYRWNALVRSDRLDAREPVLVEDGPVIGVERRTCAEGDSLIILREGPRPRTEIVLADDGLRVEIHHTLDMAALEEAEGHRRGAWYYLLFPFAVQSDGFDFQYDTASGLISPLRDVMPGAARGAWPVQSVFTFQEPGGFGLATASRQSFLWSKVPFHRLSPDPAPLKPLLASVLFGLNAYGETKDQGRVAFSLEEREPAGTSLRRFSYALTTWSGGFDPVRALRFGWEWNAPLLAKAGRNCGEAEESYRSLLEVGPDNVFVTAVKLPEDVPEGRSSEIVVRLQEVAGKEGTVADLRLRGFRVVRAVRTNLLEETCRYARGDLSTNPVRVRIGPREVATLRLLLEGGGRLPSTTTTGRG